MRTACKQGGRQAKQARAGGSGLTPMLQVLEEILRKPEDTTEVSFVYGNSTPDDILMKSHLDDLAAKHSQLSLFHYVSKPSDDWDGGEGRVTEEVVQAHIPPPGEDVLVLVRHPHARRS